MIHFSKNQFVKSPQKYQFGRGEPCSAIFQVVLNFGKIKIPVDVVSTSNVPLLLGLKFLKNYHATIDCTTTTVQLNLGKFSATCKIETKDLSEIEFFENHEKTSNEKSFPENSEKVGISSNMSCACASCAAPVGVEADAATAGAALVANLPHFPRDSKLAANLTKKYPTWKKFWTASNTRLFNLHSNRHAPHNQIMDILKQGLGEMTLDGEVLRFLSLVEQYLIRVEDLCSVCALQKRRATFPSLLSVRSVSVFNDRVSGDIFHHGSVSFLILIDYATAFVSIGILAGQSTGQLIHDTVALSWLTVLGSPRQIVLDREAAFLDAQPLLEAYGIQCLFRPGAASQTAGQVERAIATARKSLSAYDFETLTFFEQKLFAAFLANAMNNEIRTRGSSPQLRVMGFSTSLEQHALSDAANSAFSSPALVREQALKTFREAIASRSLREVLSQHRAEEKEILDPGTAIYYFRKRPGSKTEPQRHPGVVVAFDQLQSQYVVSTTRGDTVHVSPHDVSLRSLDSIQVQFPNIGRPPAEGIAGRPRTENQCTRCNNPRSKKPHAENCPKSKKFSAVLKSVECETKGGVEIGAEIAAEIDVKTVKFDENEIGKTENSKKTKKPISLINTCAKENTKENKTCETDAKYEISAATVEEWQQALEQLEALKEQARTQAKAHMEAANCPADPTHFPIEILTADDTQCLLEFGLAAEEISKYSISWDDLSKEQQNKAVREGLEPWFKYGVIKHGEELTDKQFKAMKQQRAADGETPPIEMDGRGVNKAKLMLGVLVGKWRLAVRGFKDRVSDFSESDSPTVQQNTVIICEFIGLRLALISRDLVEPLQWSVVGLDFTHAFFRISPEDTVHIGERWLKMPDEATGGRKTWYRMHKEAQGEKGAGRSWFVTLSKMLRKFGFVQTRYDPACFLLWRDGKLRAIAPVHVDDSRVWGEKGVLRDLRAFLLKEFGEFTWNELKDGKDTLDFIGIDFHTDLTAKKPFSKLSQGAYIKARVTEMKVPKGGDDTPCSEVLKEYQSCLGALLWTVLKTQRHASFEASFLSSCRNELKVGHVKQLNSVIREIRHAPIEPIIIGVAGDIKLVGICDGGLTGTRGQVAYSVGAMEASEPGTDGVYNVLCMRSQRCPRVCHSSFDVEAIAAVCLLDMLQGMSYQMDEFMNGPNEASRTERRSFIASRAFGGSELQQTSEVHTDSMSFVRGVRSLLQAKQFASQRRRDDVQDYREAIARREIADIYHISGTSNPLDAVTKPWAKTAVTRALLVQLLTGGAYEPPFT